jgi:hypothetical protein
VTCREITVSSRRKEAFVPRAPESNRVGIIGTRV